VGSQPASNIRPHARDATELYVSSMLHVALSATDLSVMLTLAIARGAGVQFVAYILVLAQTARGESATIAREDASIFVVC
jgi:hypothetical protein